MFFFFVIFIRGGGEREGMEEIVLLKREGREEMVLLKRKGWKKWYY